MMPLHCWQAPRAGSALLPGFGRPGVTVLVEFDAPRDIEQALTAAGLTWRSRPTLARRLRLGHGTEYLISQAPWSGVIVEITPHGDGLLVLLSPTSERQRQVAAVAGVLALGFEAALLMADLPDLLWPFTVLVSLGAVLWLVGFMAKNGSFVDVTVAAPLHRRVTGILTGVLRSSPRVGGVGPVETDP